MYLAQMTKQKGSVGFLDSVSIVLQMQIALVRRNVPNMVYALITLHAAIALNAIQRIFAQKRELACPSAIHIRIA